MTVVIVGAGLAGLAAARQLWLHGVECEVHEASDQVGGRVRTDRVDGLLLDRGFQLYNPAYPEGARVLDHGALHLAPLTPGLVVALAEGPKRLGDPRARLGWAMESASPSTGSLLAKARFAQYAWRTSRTPARVLERRTDVPASVQLLGIGVDARMFERVLRPFLAGVFLEGELSTSRRFMDLVLTSFVRGVPSLPADGMQAIPEQLRKALPEGTVHLQSPVAAIDGGRVRTARGTVHARFTILATDPPAATRLIPGLATPAGNSVTTWYHLAPSGQRLTDGEGVLVVDGAARGPVINSVALTNAVPSYAVDGMTGRTLVSSSALGVHNDAEPAVRRHLAVMYGVDTSGWEPVAHYPIPYALPSMRPPLQIRRPAILAERIAIAGDWRDTASIQGALVSGRRAANAVLQALGVPRLR